MSSPGMIDSSIPAAAAVLGFFLPTAQKASQAGSARALAGSIGRE